MRITILARGRTANGQQIFAVEDDGEVAIYVNMKPVRVTRQSVLRDGGTRIFDTDAGTLTLPSRIGDPDREPRWNGEQI